MLCEYTKIDCGATEVGHTHPTLVKTNRVCLRGFLDLLISTSSRVNGFGYQIIVCAVCFSVLRAGPCKHRTTLNPLACLLVRASAGVCGEPPF